MRADFSSSTIHSPTSKRPLILPPNEDTNTQLLSPSIKLKFPMIRFFCPLTVLPTPAMTLLYLESSLFISYKYPLVSSTLL